MQRRTASAIVSVAALFAVSLAMPRPVLAQGAPYCPPGQPARFVFGIAELHERLGATMGMPLECEHVNPDNGDTIQHTTTGLAYYRPSINTPVFTDGQTHWALSSNQVLMWRNPSIDPPQPTAAESSYLATVLPMDRQLDVFQSRLASVQQAADAGQIETIDVADLGALYDELATARNTLAQAPPSDRLASYDRTLLSSYDEAVAAAELLLRARLTEISEARAAFIDEAAARIAASSRLQSDAATAYTLALPVVVG